ncbi:MAG: OmpA family protein [Desulfobacteraceae bacterium]|nr:MAG: OmpA family protein [Desulfobacteraceae bacterium]
MSDVTEHNVTRPDLTEKAGIRTGVKHQFRLRPPDVANLVIAVPMAVFAFDLSFPGPGIFNNLRAIQKRSIENYNSRIVVFGHTDESGSTDYNKTLSERRANAVLALLTKRLDIFDAVAQMEEWGLSCYQAMLRAVGCNPGAIDGESGPMTEEAIRWFQREYNENVYRHKDIQRAYPDLTVDGLIGPRTKAALREAYVMTAPADIPERRFAEPAAVGCSEFNPISGEADENRRVVIAFFSTQQPRDGEFPCRQGDASACQIDDCGEMTCAFYRRNVHEQHEGPELPKFFDFEWLNEEDEKAHLSALTSIPDGTSATFTIYRWEEEEIPLVPPDSSSGDPRPTPGTELDSIDGEIAGGVCYARWTPPEDFDPFDFEQWLVDHDIELNDDTLRDLDEEGAEEADVDAESTDDEEDPSLDLESTEGMQPPVFCIEADGHWGFSAPPGKKLNRFRFDEDEQETRGLVLLTNGRMVELSAPEGKMNVRDDFEVVLMALDNRGIESEGNGRENDV